MFKSKQIKLDDDKQKSSNLNQNCLKEELRLCDKTYIEISNCKTSGSQ